MDEELMKTLEDLTNVVETLSESFNLTAKTLVLLDECITALENGTVKFGVRGGRL